MGLPKIRPTEKHIRGDVRENAAVRAWEERNTRSGSNRKRLARPFETQGKLVADYQTLDYHKGTTRVKNNYKWFVCCGIAG